MARVLKHLHLQVCESSESESRVEVSFIEPRRVNEMGVAQSTWFQNKWMYMLWFLEILWSKQEGIHYEVALNGCMNLTQPIPHYCFLLDYVRLLKATFDRSSSNGI